MKYILKVGGGEAEEDDQLGGEGGTGAGGSRNIIFCVLHNYPFLWFLLFNVQRRLIEVFTKLPPEISNHWNVVFHILM